MLTTKRVAGLITAIWVVVVGTLIVHSESSLEALRLNELGDFLAGLFAPIAFVWLVAAVWIQSAELKEQRVELALTREEMNHQRQVMTAQAEESRKQAEYIGKQTDILEAEERRRLRQQADNVFDVRMQRIKDIFANQPECLTIINETKGKHYNFVIQALPGPLSFDRLGEKLFTSFLDFQVEDDDKCVSADQPGLMTLQQLVAHTLADFDHLSPSKKIEADRYSLSLVAEAFVYMFDMIHLRVVLP